MARRLQTSSQSTGYPRHCTGTMAHCTCSTSHRLVTTSHCPGVTSQRIPSTSRRLLSLPQRRASKPARPHSAPQRLSLSTQCPETTRRRSNIWRRVAPHCRDKHQLRDDQESPRDNVDPPMAVDPAIATDGRYPLPAGQGRGRSGRGHCRNVPGQLRASWVPSAGWSTIATLTVLAAASRR